MRTVTDSTAAPDDPLADLIGKMMPEPVARGDLLRQVERSLFDEIDEPPKVGRYRIVERLGGGGQGVVYVAVDPQLDRRVAIKLLRCEGADEQAQLRLLREAIALARLSHPNVVTINDVGRCELGIYIVTQLVEGQTLTQWLAKNRMYPEIVDVFIAAGQGLAAAHAHGIVHRDFKPDNVLVGLDGARSLGRAGYAVAGVRLVDFGLARTDLEGPSTDADVASMGSGAVSGDALTGTGTVMGTPVYMAPEQHRGEPADARSDQYGFCVALYEALHGRRPFVGKTVRELAEAKQSGAPQQPASNARAVPRRVHGAVMRGLSPDPAARWPSMEGLLTQLRRRPHGGHRWVLASLGVAGLGSLAVAAAIQPATLCSGASAQLEGIWDESRRAGVESTLHAAKTANVSQTWTRVRDRLDGYAGQWAAAHADACEATRERGEASQQDMDARMQCLHDRRRALLAVVDTLSEPKPQLVHNAVEAVAELPPVTNCNDLEYVRAQVAPPQDEATRARVDQLMVQLARAGALQSAGQYEEGLKIADAVADQVDEVDYAPLVADTTYVRGQLLEATGAYEEAAELLQQAYFEWRRLGSDTYAFDAASSLVVLLGVQLSKRDEGLEWAEHAQAELEKRGDNHRGRVRLLNNLSAVHWTHGNLEEARRLLETALPLAEESLGTDDQDYATTLNNLALVAHHSGDLEGARKWQELGLEAYGRALGPDHPHAANAISNLAALCDERGELEQAEREHKRALEIREGALGPDHSRVGDSLSNLSVVYQKTGRIEEARDAAERALRIYEKSLGPDHPRVAAPLSNLATIHRMLGDLDQAHRYAARGLVISQTALGPDHPETAMGLLGVGIVEKQRGNLEEAQQQLGRCLATLEKTLGPDHLLVAHPLVALGEVAIERGRPTEAVELLRRALALSKQPEVVGEGSFALARALWQAPAGAGRDREGAVTLARQARDTFEATGDARGASLDDVNAWLKAHDR